MKDFSHIEPEIDQAFAAARDMRADKPAAHEESRCVAPPVGCGQPLRPDIAHHFRDQTSRAEYGITGLCQVCQDELFKPSLDEIFAMAADPTYERCDVCGEYRPLEFVDVGVGTISGHNCCAGIRFREDPRPPRCERTPGCLFCVDHAHHCEVYGGDPE